MQDFSSLVLLLDAQPAKMTDQIRALNALLVLKLCMVVREKLLLPRRYVAFLPPPAVEEDCSGRLEVGPQLDFIEEARGEHDLPSGSRDPHPHVPEGASERQRNPNKSTSYPEERHK